MTEFHEGGCVCKKVRYRIEGAPQRVTICHCTWCQKRTGSAFGAELVVEKDQIKFLSNKVAVYRHVSDESGRWLDQHFCSTCGSNIGLTLAALPSIQSISVGTLDDPAWLDREPCTRRHVFVRSARSWSDIPGDVEQFETHFRP